MAINIKEILDGDSPSQQVDKINYNFDQILANGGGPTGAVGSTGTQGAVGSTGAQGAQGAVGPQGATGISSDYFLKNTAAPLRDTLFPTMDPAKPNALTMVLGDDTVVAQNVTYGHIDTALYLKGSVATGMKPLRLGNQTGGYIDIDYTEAGSIRNINFIPSSLGSLSTHYKFNGQRLVLNNGADKVVLDDTLTEFNVNTVFTQNVKIASGNPGVDKVLTSDASGNTSWTQPAYYEPAYGTIVMVGNSVLNSTYLEISNLNAIGRGKGEWAGWYYCWGKSWGKASTFTHTTPDLRDRFALGYSFSDPSHSTASKTGHSLNGANNVAQLQTVDVVVPNHNHTLNFAEIEVAGSGPGTTEYALQGDTIPPATGPNNPITKTTSSAGATTVTLDLSPKTATVGYMIYLGNSSYTYN